MKIQNVFILLFIINSLTLCAKPPTIEKMSQIIPDAPSIAKRDKNSNLGLIRKRLDEASTTVENSKLTINYYDDYKTIEHQITVVPKDLPNNSYFTSWSFYTDSEGIEVISNNCEIQEKSNSKNTNKDCKTSFAANGDKTTFSYQFKLYNTEQLIVTCKYKITPKTKQILFKQEAVTIPLFSNSINCDYKFIIPNGYVNLGLENNILKKESDTVYIFKDKCPSKAENDVIRFSPEVETWDANTKLDLTHTEKFTSNIKMKFPRYYQGGKLKIVNYKITDTNNGNYDATKIIDKDDATKYNMEIPAPNKDNIAAEISTNFTNKLNDEFRVDLPEKYYAIDLSAIPKEIQDKAKEIQSEQSDFPDYYKLGKFVNEYMTYDLSYSGKIMTLDQIFAQKRGVCEHYTLLYNAMLNSIGIKTLFVAGWAFDKDQTSGDKDTIGHAWSAALIDGKWKELDSTWGLFEGVPAGHIFKNFGQDKYSYSCASSSLGKPKFENIPSIKMNSKSVENSNGNGGDKGNDNSKSDGAKNDEETDENIPIITASEGNYIKSSLILLIMLFLS